MNRLMRLTLLWWLAALAGVAQAEPYLAVRQGLKCAMCHENPSGGGLRTAFGNVFAQRMLPAHVPSASEGPGWTGALSRFVSLGADLRASGTLTDIPDRDTEDEFALDELRLYAQLNAIPERLALYADQRLAPGESSNLEAYGKLWFGTRRWYLKGGQFYLPYGLRLEDDSTLTRQVTGINMTTPDQGLELGLETGPWSAQLAVSNGTAGAPEQDSGKQWSLRGEHVRSRWRVGASFNYNASDAGDRQLQGVFAGVRTGPIAWLAEAAYILDDGFPEGRRRLWVGLIEANWLLRRGHNLKLTAEHYDPDTGLSEDEQARFALLWEYTPLPYAQLRVGVRVYEGIPQNDVQNRRQLIAELHAFF